MMISVVQDLLMDKRVYYTLVGAALIGFMASGWYGYSWYNRRNEQAAYKDLVELIDAYTKSLALPNPQKEMSDSERAFRAGSAEHNSSVLYPFFLAFQADSLIRQEKLHDAAELLDKAVKAMNVKHALYHLYALKSALVKIDTKDTALEKQGRDALRNLAGDPANPLQDMALYYSGLDADARGDQSLAKSTFQNIIAHGKKDSYWYQLASSKLKTGD